MRDTTPTPPANTRQQDERRGPRISDDEFERYRATPFAERIRLLSAAKRARAVVTTGYCDDAPACGDPECMVAAEVLAILDGTDRADD